MEVIAQVYSFTWADLLSMDREQLDWWHAAARQRMKERAAHV
jgi:hypothetical protein